MESNEIHHTASETHKTPVTRYDELQALVAKMAPDFEKFYKDGNKAAGTRVRNAMQELKTFAQAVRTEVQAIKNEAGAEKQPQS
jgi:N-acetylglucosamine kinase-like BadF-type ATPase